MNYKFVVVLLILFTFMFIFPNYRTEIFGIIYKEVGKNHGQKRGPREINASGLHIPVFSATAQSRAGHNILWELTRGKFRGDAGVLSERRFPGKRSP